MRRALLAFAALSFGPACGGLTTLGPTAAGEGIDFYVHANFAGSSQSVNIDVRDLDKVEGPCPRGEEGEPPTWSDCISSVRVHPGWSATLYKDRDFKGPARP
jgi:peptidase inhibitor family I36